MPANGPLYCMSAEHNASKAAAMMAQNQPAPRPPRTSSARPDYNKPPPPGPGRQDLRPDDRYGRGNGSGGGGGYDSRPPPGAYDDPRYGGRQPSPRYDQQSHHPRLDGYGSPPPQNYGHGPPPQGYHGRPPIQNRPPPTPQPPRDGNDREALWRLFGAVDKDGSGQLTEAELRTALVNGDWSPFDPHTVRMMIRMFDTDRSGTINFEEFCGLWGFLSAWRGLFDRFDVDHSGNISYKEFTEALVAFGYRLSPQFVTLLYRTYDRRGENAISFDLFVQACISLKRMTDVFKKYDEDRDGYITLSL
ncbi:EF-hand [Zopfia rhizophila CBS 207.26]|uniref:EF-hand n=1 Tax=Zopfia rhizophila CBS 207.26 TaxID=1314779 RepID=A0A6A6E956_9PEZI|nr:EF-hand [Zopfia rhizophila CBS 207.26]